MRVYKETKAIRRQNIRHTISKFTIKKTSLALKKMNLLTKQRIEDREYANMAALYHQKYLATKLL